ncbi:MAG: hypothetical protein U0822_04680 [Anaerolineae bacterium]
MSTPNNAHHPQARTRRDAPAARAERRYVEQPNTSDDDNSAKHDGRQRREQRCEEEQEDDGERCGDEADPLGFAAHLIVDSRARRARRGRKAGQETGADIGHAERDEFLVGVDLLAVLGRKGARGQDLISINQDRQRKRAGQQRKDVLKRDRRNRHMGQPGRHRADDRYTLCFEIEDSRGNNAQRYDDERAGQGAIRAANDEQSRHADNANRDGEQVRLVKAADKLHNLLEELVALELDAKHLAQLAADHDECRASDVADEDWLGEEVGDEAEPRDAGEQRQDTNENRGHGGERGVARGVTACQWSNNGGGQDRGRCLGAHDHLFAGAKEGVHHHGAERDVKPGDRRDAGEIAVGHRGRHEYRKHREGNDEVSADKRRTESFYESKPGNEPRNACGGGLC